MKWEIKIEKRAQKELNRIPLLYQKKILAVFPIIAANPFCGKKLEGELAGFYSYRVWPYRIIYRIYKQILVIVIVQVGHRQGIY